MKKIVLYIFHQKLWNCYAPNLVKGRKMLLNFYLKLLILYTKHLTIRITQEIFTDWFTTTTITIPYHSVRYVDLNNILLACFVTVLYTVHLGGGWVGDVGTGGLFLFLSRFRRSYKGLPLGQDPVLTDNFGKFYWMFLIQIDDSLILLIIFRNYKITSFTISECV